MQLGYIAQLVRLSKHMMDLKTCIKQAWHLSDGETKEHFGRAYKGISSSLRKDLGKYETGSNQIIFCYFPS